MTSAAETVVDKFGIGGIVTGVLTVPRSDLERVLITGAGEVTVHRLEPGAFALATADAFGTTGRTGIHIPNLGQDEELAVVCFGGRHNAYVNQGLQHTLDSAYSALTAQRITHIGLSSSTATVTATTTSLAPTGSTSIKTIANVSRTNQTVHGDQTWTQADVAFAITKIGLLKGSAATDVLNIIGGTGGASPYNEPFTIDLTSIATWSLTMGIDVTATAS